MNKELAIECIETQYQFVDELTQKAFDKAIDLLRNTKTGKWIKVSGYATPSGDPVWCCSECGKGVHVYGIEHKSYGADIADHQWVACPNCGTRMILEV